MITAIILIIFAWAVEIPQWLAIAITVVCGIQAIVKVLKFISKMHDRGAW